MDNGERRVLREAFCVAMVLLMAGFFCAPWAVAAQKDAIKMILTHEVATSHFKHTLMLKYAKMVDEKSAGRIKCEVYPGGQLYSDRDAVAALGTGSVQMTWPVSVGLEQVNEAYGVVNLPLALDDELMLKSTPFRNGLKDLLSNLVSGKNIKVVGLFRTSGGVFAFARKDVKRPEELKGLKIRVAGGLIVLDWLRELGASTIGMPASEMTTALTQGAIDGVMSSPQGWSEIIGSSAKFGVDIKNFWLPTYSALIDRKFFDKLSPDLQKVVQDSLDEISQYQWQYSIDEDKKALDKVRKDLKAKINLPSAKELSGPWLSKTRPAIERFQKKFPDCYKNFVSLNSQYGRQYPPKE